MAQTISPEWKRQYARERKYEHDFAYAAGKKSLKGGIGNPKNWPGGKSEMGHDPHLDRRKLENTKLGTRKKTAKKPTKKAAKKKTE